MFLTKSEKNLKVLEDRVMQNAEENYLEKTNL